MNKPEDDPVVVTLVASNLLGRTCQDWPTALAEAHHALKIAPGVIKAAKEQQKARAKIWADIAREHGSPYWIGEENFINWLVEDLIKETRFDRRKKFVALWWARLRAAQPEAPALEDKDTWCSDTLWKWKDAFVDIHRQQRAMNCRNARKCARIQSKKILDASFLASR